MLLSARPHLFFMVPDRLSTTTSEGEIGSSALEHDGLVLDICRGTT